MIPDHLRRALEEFKEGKLTSDQIEHLLEHLPYEDLGFAKVDHHRALRHGFAEVVFGKGKTPDQILSIAQSILAKHPNLLITHVPEGVFDELKSRAPEAEFHALSRVIAVVRDPVLVGRGTVGVVAAGTADIPVAEEAAITARVMGNEVATWNDVGVAGIHRVLRQVEALRSCSVMIAVAGMEGALPSVVGGLVEVPVIAVPTSVGYGASFGGLAALLGMLNSCSSNVTVVNIDNGFGAGYVASLINRRHGAQ
jgi:pyridinium-3,5-biscarboxylic acid mononucleotide synthase